MATAGGSGAMTMPALGSVHVAGRRVDVPFLVILVIALALRVYLGTTAPYIHDEENNSILRVAIRRYEYNNHAYNGENTRVQA